MTTDAAWVRAARERLGLTQTELAEALHVAQATVSNWESGARSVTARTRAQIEALLAGE